MLMIDFAGEYTSALYEMQQMSADIATAAGFTRHYPDRTESLLQKCFTIPENEPANVLEGSFFQYMESYLCQKYSAS